MPLVYTFSTGGTRPTIRNLRAKTWCEGERVDLSWEAPEGVVVTHYKVKRSRRTFALYVDDETETIYTGTALSLSDINLEDNTIYYYAVFWTDDGTNYYIGDEARVAGLSIRDYELTDGEDWLYKRLQRALRRMDEAPGEDQGTLKRYMKVLQCGVSLFRGYVEAFKHLPNADKTIAGRVGDAANQYAYLEGLNKELGFEAQRALGLEVMRRVSLGIVRVRRKKGTCPGLADFIKLLTGWDGVCSPVMEGSCGGGTLFRTWDGVSSFQDGDGVIEYPAGTSPTLVFATPGSFEDSAAAWTPGLYAGGVLIDFVGNVHCIEDNTADTVTFKDTTALVKLEDAFTGCTFAGFGTDTIVITQTVLGKPFNTSMYVGNYAKVNAGTGKHQILSATASATGDELTLVLSSATNGAATAIAVAFDYLNEPLTFANRDVDARYKVYDGEHYFLWNPKFDERLRGTAEDPFDVLWTGDTFSATPYSDADVVFWVDAGVAVHTGTSTFLDNVSIQVSAPTFTAGALAGAYLNPNRGQTKLWRILSNTTTEIVVEPAESGNGLTDVAVAGNNFYVLREPDAVRFQAVYNTVKRILPHLTRLFLWFH